MSACVDVAGTVENYAPGQMLIYMIFRPLEVIISAVLENWWVVALKINAGDTCLL